MPTRLPEENGLPLAGFNKRDVPVGLEDSHGNPRKSRSRAYIENRYRFVGCREMSREKDGFAIVTDHHLRPRLYGGQVHSLVSTDQQFVVRVELNHL